MRSGTVLALGLLTAIPWSGLAGQTLTSDPFDGLPSALDPGEEGVIRKRLVFHLDAEIPLPGPLPGVGPRREGQTIVIPVAGGTARVQPVEGAEPRVTAGARLDGPDTGEETWVENDRGRLRFRAESSGLVRAERRCKRCSRGWKKKWKLRAPGVSPVPPLVVGKRVCFGSNANSVYCVKTRNGHRLWAAAVDGRVSQRLVHWDAAPEAPESRPAGWQRREAAGALLAVLEQGSELVALSAHDGLEIASMKLASGEGKIVSVPVTTGDGRVVTARQGYAEADAALAVYRLVEPRIEAPETGDADDP